MTKKSKIALLGIAAALTFGSASLAAISYAKYVRGDDVGQELTRKGVENTSLFLNANIWTRGTADDGTPVTPVYYMWVIVSGISTGYLVAPSRHVTPTVSGTAMDLYVFEYKYEWITASRQIIMLRANPNVTVTNNTTYPSSAIWNQTAYIPFANFLGHANGYNYICIDSWDADGEGGYTDSGYSCNKIIKNESTGALTWFTH